MSLQVTPNIALKLQFLKEALRSGKVKFIHKQDFRKDFVKVYESTYSQGVTHGILMKGKVAVMIVKGDVLTSMMEVVDALTSAEVPSDKL